MQGLGQIARGPCITKKGNKALKKKYCDLDEKHKELEMQYVILWDSSPHLPKAKETSTPSTSHGCENILILI